MKKILAFALTAVMVLSMFAGCGNSDSTDTNNPTDGTAPAGSTASANPSSEEVTLTMVESLTSPERSALLQNVIDKYEAEHPNVHIELVSPPLENADAKITQMLMSGKGIDIVEVRDHTIAQFVNNGWLSDLTTYIDAWSEKDTLTEAVDVALRTGVRDGKKYLLPYGFYQRCLFYRTDLLEKAGLEVPTTWQELYEAAVKLNKPEENQYGFAFRGGKGSLDNAITTVQAWLGTDKFADVNASWFLKEPEGATIFSTPEVKEAFEFWKAMYNDASPKDSVAWGYPEMVQGFIGGTCAFLIQDAEVIATCANDMDPAIWNTGLHPTGPSGQSIMPNGYAGWGMTSFTEHPDVAADFILFLSNAENNTEFCVKHGLIPIHSTAGEIDDSFSTGYYACFTKMAEKPDIYRFAQRPTAYMAYGQFNAGDGDAMFQKYLTDEITVDEFVNWMDSYWQQAYADEGALW